MKVYVASSWKNETQKTVVEALRKVGHNVYDFRNPNPGDTGFSWKGLLKDNATLEEYREFLLTNDRCIESFYNDFDAMKWADACVLVLPCGRSAHLEAGWFARSNQRSLYILLSDDGFEPDLMYLMATGICVNIAEVLEFLSAEQAHAEKVEALCE